MKNSNNWVSFQYEQEMAKMIEKVNESSLIPTSIRLDIGDIAFYTAISERFGQSRNSLIQELLHDAIDDLFIALEPKDRIKVGECADEKASELYTKHGISHSQKFSRFKNQAGFYNTADEKQRNKS